MRVGGCGWRVSVRRVPWAWACEGVTAGHEQTPSPSHWERHLQATASVEQTKHRQSNKLVRKDVSVSVYQKEFQQPSNCRNVFSFEVCIANYEIEITTIHKIHTEHVQNTKVAQCKNTGN